MFKKNKATFAAGCFWGVEDKFSRIKGIISTQVGYTGGHVENPSYETVCTGTTGHAEAVELIFDPDIVSYGRLLEIFWKIHNPTTLNRQGFDRGEQYRSAIFYHDDEQRELAQKSKTEAQKTFENEIVTQIVPAQEFYRAEEYHQRKLTKLKKKR